ncbi:MAG TPA: Flp family type IVb pilin [Longimicrobiales bacterium]|nr:Flp family type IVb pilin [Longimicrobiales bacterium]
MNADLRMFWRDEAGQDLAEYALLLALIAVVLVTAISSLRTAIANSFGRATNVLNSAGVS